VRFILRFLILLFFIILSNDPLIAQRSSDTAEASEPPSLAGIVNIDSLSLLWPDDPQAADLEPVDMAAGADGPIILFTDRFLSLGSNLEITRRTVQDLAGPSNLPPGLIPSRLLLSPFSEPLVYSSESGELLLFHLDGSTPDRFETGFLQASEATSLLNGGILLSDGKQLSMFSRRGIGVSRENIPLPLAFPTGLHGDDQERLWIYDLASRKVRVFSLDGEPLFSITPAISGGTLLFPQVFKPRLDGGFFLGSAGELWCFNHDGTLRWRLNQFSTDYRQALPAFYHLAEAKGKENESASSFYILDPLGRRILKFSENADTGGAGTNGEGSSGASRLNKSLVRIFGDLSLHGRQNELVRLCLENELLLQAAFFRRDRNGETVVTDLNVRLKSKQARLQAEVAEQLENELRFQEAEAAYNHALSLFRELRNLDPVDPRYPKAIRELSKERNEVQKIHFAERLLAARRADEPPPVEGQRQDLSILLSNASRSAAEQVEVLVRIQGYPGSRWQSSIGKIAPDGEVRLKITFAVSEGTTGGRINREDLYLYCNLLVRFKHNGENAVQYFRLPIKFPAGTMRLPGPK
jgi:hypothetical protein